MSVYLVAAPSLGLCKVGYAVSVQRRLLVIQTFTPAPVELLAARDGCRFLEGAIHRALRSDRVHGEWFRLTERTLHVFHATQLETPGQLGAGQAPMHGISGLVQRAVHFVGSEARLAAACGVSQPAINLAKHSGRVSARLARRIHEATQGQVPKHRLCPDVFDPPAAHGGPLAAPVIPSSSSDAVAGSEGTTNGERVAENLGAENANAHR